MRQEMGQRILIVENDGDIADLVRDALVERGYLVQIAQDGVVGLAMTAVKNPDLIVLDMMLPRMSGFIMIEKIYGGLISDCPIIVITANEGRRHRQYAQLLGVRDYFVKPFDVRDLVDRINELLSEKRATSIELS